MRPYNYERTERLVVGILTDLGILSGDLVGRTDASWQDVAGTAAVQLRVLADILQNVREHSDAFPVFPSPEVCLHQAYGHLPPEQEE